MPFESHDLFVTPPPDAKLWRFTNFTKFIDALERSSLFFSRADLLGDRFEGSLARPNISQRATVYAEVLSRIGEEKWRDVQETYRRMLEGARFNTYISSWHVGEYESAAMWGLYTPPSEGIAIRTTFARLRDSLRTDHRVHIGQVTYMDYETSWIPEGNSLAPFVHKRRSYDFESELRAVIQEFLRAGNEHEIDPTRHGPPGVRVPVDLGILIESVWVSPSAPAWLSELVRDVARRYRSELAVFQSSLADDPIF